MACVQKMIYLVNSFLLYICSLCLPQGMNLTTLLSSDYALCLCFFPFARHTINVLTCFPTEKLDSAGNVLVSICSMSWLQKNVAVDFDK